MKKLLAILFAAAMTLSLAACGAKNDQPADASGDAANTSGEAKYRVAYFNRDDADDFLANVRDGVQALCEAQGDIDFVSYNGAGDAAKQITQIEDAINKGVDCVIILPQDKESVASQVKECNEKNIPVLTVSVGLAEESGDFTYIGSDDYTLAYQETEYMLNHMEPGEKFIYLRFVPGSFVAAQRHQGTIDAIAALGREDDMLTQMDYKNTTADAQKLMEDLLQVYGDDWKGVLSHNDKSIYGVINAVNAAGIDPSTKVICSIDGEVSACQLIKAGQLTMSVKQDVDDMCAKTLDAINAVREGKELEHNIYSNAISVDASNVDDYLQ